MITVPNTTRSASEKISWFRFAATLLAGTLALTACSGDNASGQDQANKPGGNTGEAAKEVYPVTIDTAHGEITLEEKPERIVAIGHELVDALFSIDETPIAYGADKEGLFIQGGPEEAPLEFLPWLEGIDVTETEWVPELISSDDGVSAEAIAALEPDLIVGNIYSIDDQVYEQLSQIAPTYAGIEAETNTDWDDSVTALGALTGKTDEAAQVVADLEAEFVAARDRIPNLQNKTYNTGSYMDQTFWLGSGGEYYIDMGLEPAEGQPVIMGGDNPSISLENIDQLTADVLFIFTYGDEEARKELESDPRFTELPAVQNDAVFWTTNPMAQAENLTGPHSQSWFLEQTVSLLEETELNQ